MAIIAKANDGGGTFTPCPAGMQRGVCVDVVDLGLVENTLFPNKDGSPKLQHKINVVWESEERMEDGRPYLVSKRYTLSLGEKATLRNDLESWRGKPFSEAELDGFDVERLIGVSALLNVVHKTGSKGGTFANVVTVAPLMRSMEKLKASGSYTRVCDRKPKPQPDPDEAPTDDDFTMTPDIEDIGF